MLAMSIRRDHADLFAFARTSLTNARDQADVQAILADYGYDEAALNEGLELVGRAETKAQRQVMEYAEQFSATADVNDAAALLRATYTRHVQLARILFKERTTGYTKLGLGGRRPKALPELLATSRKFYTVLLEEPDILADLTRFNITQNEAELGMAEVEAVDAGLVVQQKETGEAQVATKLRDDVVALLRGYMHEYVRVVKIALAGHPQLRKKVGILERS